MCSPECVSSSPMEALPPCPSPLCFFACADIGDPTSDEICEVELLFPCDVLSRPLPDDMTADCESKGVSCRVKYIHLPVFILSLSDHER